MHMFDHCNMFYLVCETKSNYWKKFDLVVKQKLDPWSSGLALPL